MSSQAAFTNSAVGLMGPPMSAANSNAAASHRHNNGAAGPMQGMQPIAPSHRQPSPIMQHQPQLNSPIQFAQPFGAPQPIQPGMPPSSPVQALHYPHSHQQPSQQQPSPQLNVHYPPPNSASAAPDHNVTVSHPGQHLNQNPFMSHPTHPMESAAPALQNPFAMHMGGNGGGPVHQHPGIMAHQLSSGSPRLDQHWASVLSGQM
jgi:hypothetical protein